MERRTTARDEMAFSGKLTGEDWKDAGDRTRSKLYWPKLLLTNWYGTALIAALVWATIAGLLGQTDPNWLAMGLIWAVIVAVFAWTVFRVKSERTREIARMNDALPDTIRFTNEGIALDGPDGAAAFRPWRHFNGWREGRRVLILDRPHVKSAVILSIAELPEIERERVRQFLQASIAAEPKA